MLPTSEFLIQTLDDFQEAVGVVRRLHDALEQLVLPLANQGFRHNQENAARAFGATLRNDEAGLDRLSQTNFVRKNASAFAKPAKREDHGINLKRVRVEAPGAATRRSVPD